MNFNEMSDKRQLILQFCNKYLPWCMILLAVFARKLHNTKQWSAEQERMAFLLAYDYRKWLEYSPLIFWGLRNELRHCLMTRTQDIYRKSMYLQCSKEPCLCHWVHRSLRSRFQWWIWGGCHIRLRASWACYGIPMVQPIIRMTIRLYGRINNLSVFCHPVFYLKI